MEGDVRIRNGPQAYGAVRSALRPIGEFWCALNRSRNAAASRIARRPFQRRIKPSFLSVALRRVLAHRRGSAVGRWLPESFASFLRLRRGGGMLIGGVFALMAMATAGSAMSNYAWREAQWEQVRAAVHAAISAAGPLLSGAGDAAVNLKIAERVAGFAEASLPGFSVASGDVTVSHDSGTGVTTIGVSGAYTFSDLWLVGDTGGAGQADGERVTVSIRSKLEADRYEVAVALDVSTSMLGRLASGNGGTRVSRLDGLKSALGSVADAMQSASEATPGSMLVSLVPYATAVRVADTAGGDPGEDEVFVTPDAEALKTAFVDLFTVRRNLRFLV